MSPVFLILLVSNILYTASGIDTSSLQHIANVTYASESKVAGQASIFSPRMDFEQWKPLTGRGDPLRNDPTYDYEPPVLDRVHYWADDTRPEAPPHKPDRKSEVLVLGVSSRRPSLTPRQPPRRQHRPPHPPPTKYQDYSYKLGDHYPMTILVPPPPPPLQQHHQPPIYLLTDEKLSTPPHQNKATMPPTPAITEVTENPTHLTSLYALQEANLIYQSSTVSENWAQNNQTRPFVENAVSSDYAGWGPTTPLFEEDNNNDTNNFIFNEQFEVSKHPYAFYRPMLSEAPPPPRYTPNPLLLPSSMPTALPLKPTTQSTPMASPIQSPIHTTRVVFETTTEVPYTETQYFSQDITTDNNIFQPTPLPPLNTKTETIFDMLGPMMGMPMANGAERPEDNLYAHASENLHVFQNKEPINDAAKLETMQTMQPPPPIKNMESTSPTYIEPYRLNTNSLNILLHKETFKNNMLKKDPYLLSSLTTPMPTVAPRDNFENTKTTTDPPGGPMYLIIQGHSKVKTYSSKAKPSADKKDTIDNEIPKKHEEQQVKHLHSIKEKYNSKKVEKFETDRTKYGRSLKKLLSDGVGSIDIQEADVGIKYDVSDGSDVPVEIYKKGIVESDENDYSSNNKKKRSKRQVQLEDLIPFDEDTIEEFVYNYLNGKKNDTGITGLIAKAVTSDAADAVDEFEDDDDDDEDR